MTDKSFMCDYNIHVHTYIKSIEDIYIWLLDMAVGRSCIYMYMHVMYANVILLHLRAAICQWKEQEN